MYSKTKQFFIGLIINDQLNKSTVVEFKGWKRIVAQTKSGGRKRDLLDSIIVLNEQNWLVFTGGGHVWEGERKQREKKLIKTITK